MNIPILKLNFYTCFLLIKKLFRKQGTSQIVSGTNYLLTAAINNYIHPEHRLKGCLNDQKLIKKIFHNYLVLEMKDNEVTINNFKRALKTIIDFTKDGDQVVIHYSGHGTQVPDENSEENDNYDEAFFLYDGILLDDEFGYILSNVKPGVNVLLLIDACHSGNSSRSTIKKRFVKIANYPLTKKKFHKQEKIKWTIISACKEHESAADAFIDSDYYGAFTYYLHKATRPGQTVKDWFDKLTKTNVKRYQNPTIEGVGINNVFNI